MRDKIAGAIYGMALGDAMGMPSELWGREKVRKYFGKIEGLLDGPKENSVACNYKKGQFTDDTGQALVIIDSLKDTKFKPNSKDIATKLLKWAQTYDRFEKVAAFLYELSATNNIEKNLLFGDIPYTHQEIADSLAISRVTVTKVLNQFKDEGLISIEYGHIKVLKRDKLYEQYLSTLV